jgi:hypothetical protein
LLQRSESPGVTSRECQLINLFSVDSESKDIEDRNQTVKENREMLSWLFNLVKNQKDHMRLRLIVLSRPTVKIIRDLGGGFHSIIVEEHNGPAIEAIVDDGLRSIKDSITRWMQMDGESSIEEDDEAEKLPSTEEKGGSEMDEPLEYLGNRLLEGAYGQIQWVKLVLLELEREIGNKGAWKIEGAENIMRDIPSGLEDLYEEFIKRLERRLGDSELSKARNMLK